MEAWKGFKTFKVGKRVDENQYIASFYLIPMEEGKKLPEYLPGQFIAVRVLTENGTYSKVRQYTLSEASNGEYYRISVKREEAGEVSKLLCDTVKEGDLVEITSPKGKFILEEGTGPVVLIGGGIGITPMLTMAQEAALKDRQVHLIYSLPNSAYFAFGEEIKEVAKSKTVKTTIAYTRPTQADEEAALFDVKGRLTKEWMKDQILKEAEIYFCGPVEFMRTVYHYLVELGVELEKIHYELFTPGEDITKPA